MSTKKTLLRARGPHQHHRVTYVELFFDLVFVFAITQISHTLLAHFTPLGVLQTAILFLAVWWVWIYTSWITNWLDPERTPIRVMLFGLMIAGLLLSTSIPKALKAGDWRSRWPLSSCRSGARPSRTGRSRSPSPVCA